MKNLGNGSYWVVSDQYIGNVIPNYITRDMKVKHYGSIKKLFFHSSYIIIAIARPP